MTYEDIVRTVTSWHPSYRARTVGIEVYSIPGEEGYLPAEITVYIDGEQYDINSLPPKLLNMIYDIMAEWNIRGTITGRSIRLIKDIPPSGWYDVVEKCIDLGYSLGCLGATINEILELQSSYSFNARERTISKLLCKKK